MILQKLFYSALLAFVCAPFVMGQKPYSGVMHLEFGYITLPNGVQVSVKGLDVPWTAVPAKLLRKGQKPPRQTGGFTDNVVIYQNDNAQHSYNGIGVPAPSTLDDMIISGSGTNLPWQLASFGINASTGDRVLIRWRFFNDTQSGLGQGVSAFYNEIDDFGGYWTPPSGANPYYVTFTWGAVYGFSVPDASIYMAMQFREPAPFPWMEQGEGFFREDYSPLFHGSGVTVGSSEDFFYLDSDQNGIYDETEIDQFDPPGVPNLANIACKFDVSGTITEVLPQTRTIIIGMENAGSIFDTWGSDDVYYEVRDHPKLVDQAMPIAIRIESTVTGTTTNLTSLRFTFEAHGSMASSQQRMWLRNFVTSQWVLLSTSTLQLTDTTVSALVPTSMNPNQFVQAGTKKVWTLVGIDEPTAPYAPGPYFLSIDKASWVITRP